MGAEAVDTTKYMVAAYVVTAVILVGYALVLWRRYRRGGSE